jgi:hypothetical protein
VLRTAGDSGCETYIAIEGVWISQERPDIAGPEGNMCGTVMQGAEGKHSVGVAAQSASALGKTANCQKSVSLTLARGEAPVMIALRPFRELDERCRTLEARRRTGQIPTATIQAGDRVGRS